MYDARSKDRIPDRSHVGVEQLEWSFWKWRRLHHGAQRNREERTHEATEVKHMQKNKVRHVIGQSRLPSAKP